MSIDELKDRYMVLCHAMQSGVSGKMIFDKHDTEPKHLRVGINSAMVSNHALVKLLLEKGIINEKEFWESLVYCMFDEVVKYEKYLSKKAGKDVHLI